MLKDAACNMGMQLDRSRATVAVTGGGYRRAAVWTARISRCMACRATVTFHLISHFMAVIWLQSRLIIHNNARPLNQQYIMHVVLDNICLSVLYARKYAVNQVSLIRQRGRKKFQIFKTRRAAAGSKV